MSKDYSPKPLTEVSKLDGQKYNLWEQIHILNINQAHYYMDEGVHLTDIDFSVSRRDETKPVVVFLFKRADTQEAYDKWCKRKHD